MRINNNTAAVTAWTDYTDHLDKLRDSMKRLSTGIILTGDDPAGIGISARLSAQALSVEAARGNADDGISMMQTADSWLQRINDMMSNMQGMVVEASGLTSTQDIANIQIEFENIQDEIISITSKYNATGKYNGLYLFRGGNGTTGYQDSILSTGGRAAERIGDPQVVVSGNGSSELIALAGGGYIASNSTIDGVNSGIQLYDDDGNTIGGADVSVDNATNIVALAKGGFLTYTGGTVQEYDRYGDTVGSSISLSTSTIQSITALANGDFVSVIGTGASESVVLFDVSLSSASAVTVTNTDTTATAKVAVYESGAFLIADGAGINKYDSNGVVTTSGFTGVTESGDVEDVITLKDGSFIAQTGSGAAASFQRYYSNGAQLGDAITITDAVVDIKALDDGGFIIVATDDVNGGTDNVLNLHRYSSDNSAFEVLKASTGSNTVSDVDVVILETGDIVAEWGESSNSYAVRFDLDVGAVTQIGADNGQDFVIDLPNLQVNNYRVIGSYNDGTNDQDVRWATILDSDSLTVSTTDAISIIGEGIDYVSSARALIASQQNVLQNRKEGLLTYQDNLEAAESKIRDVDIAQETIEFSQRQIQLNAANAMLAQANAMPNSVLDLL